MYIITRRLNCTAGFTAARLNVDVPVWRDDADWKRAARIRAPTGKTFTSGLSRSRTTMRRVSMKFRAKRIEARIQVAVLGNSSV
jgi:hypothetical protein